MTARNEATGVQLVASENAVSRHVRSCLEDEQSTDRIRVQSSLRTTMNVIAANLVPEISPVLWIDQRRPLQDYVKTSSITQAVCKESLIPLPALETDCRLYWTKGDSLP